MEKLQTLTKNIKTHNDINSKIENLNKILSKLRTERSELENSIISEINHLNLSNNKLKIDNTHYFLGISKTSPNINLTLIQKIGNEFLGEETTNLFLKKIKEYRDNNAIKTTSVKRKPCKTSRSKKSKIPIRKDKSLKRCL